MESKKRDSKSCGDKELVGGKTAKKPKPSFNVSEESVFEIGSMRRVQVSEFKGKMLVNIREFYTDKATGEEKPGNKGIALTLEQWESLKSQMELIDEVIALKTV